MIAPNYRAAFERLRCGLLRRAGRDVDLLKRASAEILDPGETVSGKPSIVLPNQFDRVRSCGFGRDVAEEIAQTQGAPREIGPTIRYVVEDVVVDRGIIYGRGAQTYFNAGLDFGPAKAPWAEYEDVALRSSFIGCYFFGHWLRDDCATHLLAEQRSAPMSMPTPVWPDVPGYLDVLGQSYGQIDRGYVKHLTLFEDICNTPHKIARLRQLRARIAATQPSKPTGKIVYLMRGSAGKPRTLVNEMEIVEQLKRRDIVVVEAEKLSVPLLVSELFNARIVISIEGSQFSHALMTLSDAGAILVIQPPDRFFNSHMDWARALDIQYGLVVGEQKETGFYLPIDDLLRTIDLLDAGLG
jgi:hypothetical protein